MNPRDLWKSIKPNAALLLMLAPLAVLWATLVSAGSLDPTRDLEEDRTRRALLQGIQAFIKQDDTVFFSSQDLGLRRGIAELTALVYEIDPEDAAGLDSALGNLLDQHCMSAEGIPPPSAYLIWTDDGERETLLLGESARRLRFHFAFETVLPFEGESAFAFDNLVRLQPKAAMLRTYCSVRDIAGDRPALVLLGARRFSPWIRPVVTGPVTWIASEPVRHMEESHFAIQDMPPKLTYDVYWMGQVPMVPSWSFANQDRTAFAQAVEVGKSQGSLVLMERGAALDAPALNYLERCPVEDRSFADSPFRQMCFK